MKDSWHDPHKILHMQKKLLLYNGSQNLRMKRKKFILIN